MRKKGSWIGLFAIMLTMVSALVLGACGDKKKNVTLTITPATWNNEGYTITNADYKFEDIEDGGKKVVFDYKKKAIDITLYVKPNEGYIIDNAIMRAVTTNYLNNDTNYGSYAIEKGLDGKITIKSVDQDIVLIIERVRRANMFIFFDAMGGTYTDNNPLYVFGDMGSTSSASAPTQPTKENHKFDGWWTGYFETNDTDEEVFVYDKLYDFDNITLVPDVTLYAKWIAKSTLTFDTVGGSNVPSQELYDQVALRPTNPTKEHNRFDGWYTTSTYDEGTQYSFEEPVTSDTTLYAKWIEGIDFTFYLNDGSVDTDGNPTVWHRDTVYDVAMEEPAKPERAGYRFDGWYTTAECEEGTAFDFATVVTQDTQLYAKWVEGVKVTFYLNDGSETQKEWKIGYAFNGVLDALTDQPTREDAFVFTYWSTDVNGEGKYDFTQNITEPLSLYAQWAEAVVISFVTNNEGEIAPKKIEKGKGLDKVVAGNYVTDDQEDLNVYVFSGWTLTQGGQDIIDLVTATFGENTTLYAVYTAKDEFVFMAEGLDESIFESVKYYDSYGAYEVENGADSYISGKDAQSFVIEIMLTPESVANNTQILALVIKDYNTGEELQRVQGEQLADNKGAYAFDIKNLSSNVKISFEIKRGI